VHRGLLSQPAQISSLKLLVVDLQRVLVYPWKAQTRCHVTDMQTFDIIPTDHLHNNILTNLQFAAVVDSGKTFREWIEQTEESPYLTHNWKHVDSTVLYL